VGASAVPALEVAFDSIEALGERSPFAFHDSQLMNAYARIRGPAAYPRLLGMLQNRRLTGSEEELDSAIATALNLSSYVSDMRGTIPVFGQHTGRRERCAPPGTTDPLNDLILAWETDDVRLLEASLGPSAIASLKSMLAGKTWEGLRAEIWPEPPSRGVAMGFELRDSGTWSPPGDGPDGIGAANNGSEHTMGLEIMSAEINALFKDGSGNICGKRRIRFRTTGRFIPMVVIDDPDLGGLLRLISSCATVPENRN